MAIETAPLPVPPTADASKLKDFGREVKGVDPGVLTPGEFQEVHDLLYKVLSMLDARELSLLTVSVPRIARRSALPERGPYSGAAVCTYEGMIWWEYAPQSIHPNDE